MARPRTVIKSKDFLTNEKAEWDFAGVPGYQKPMAVAWEYSRELAKLVGKKVFVPPAYKFVFQGQKHPLTPILKSEYLDTVYCSFLMCVHWPGIPFRKLSYTDLRHAFENASWPRPKPAEKTQWINSSYFKSSPRFTDPCFVEGNTNSDLQADFLKRLVPPIIRDLTPTGIINKETFKLEGLTTPAGNGQRRLHPSMKIVLIDMDRHPWQIEDSLKQLLKDNNKLLERGRSDYEKDLSALTIYRLKKFFGSLSKMENAIQENLGSSKKKAVKEATKNSKEFRRNSIVSRELWAEYLKHAHYRLGLEKCPHDDKDSRFVSSVFCFSVPSRFLIKKLNLPKATLKSSLQPPPAHFFPFNHKRKDRF